MTEIKHQLAEAAEHAKNVASETASKVGHAASEALLKSEHLLAEKMEHARNVGAENISKASHAATEAVHKGEKSLNKMGQKVEALTAKAMNAVKPEPIKKAGPHDDPDNPIIQP